MSTQPPFRWGAVSYSSRRRIKGRLLWPLLLEIDFEALIKQIAFCKHHSSLILQILMIRCRAIMNFSVESGCIRQLPAKVGLFFSLGGGESCVIAQYFLNFKLPTEMYNQL